MSITLIIILAIVALFMAIIVVNYYKMKNLKNVPSHSNIKNLNNKNFQAQSKKGVVLVDFWAPWCGPCKMMGPILNELAEANITGASIAKVDVDKEQALAAKYKIRSIPTMVLLKNGKEVNRYSGVKTKKFLEKEILKQLED